MAQIDWDSLGFDAYRTRTVVLAHYRDGAWSDIELTETFSFTIEPFMQGLHYAISCFEGLKAFHQKDGSIIMFRRRRTPPVWPVRPVSWAFRSPLRNYSSVCASSA